MCSKAAAISRLLRVAVPSVSIAAANDDSPGRFCGSATAPELASSVNATSGRPVLLATTTSMPLDSVPRCGTGGANTGVGPPAGSTARSTVVVAVFSDGSGSTRIRTCPPAKMS